jgi:hypothetical protein
MLAKSELVLKFCTCSPRQKIKIITMLLVMIITTVIMSNMFITVSNKKFCFNYDSVVWSSVHATS